MHHDDDGDLLPQRRRRRCSPGSAATATAPGGLAGGGGGGGGEQRLRPGRGTTRRIQPVQEGPDISQRPRRRLRCALPARAHDGLPLPPPLDPAWVELGSAALAASARAQAGRPDAADESPDDQPSAGSPGFYLLHYGDFRQSTHGACSKIPIARTPSRQLLLHPLHGTPCVLWFGSRRERALRARRRV